ncbi:MAG: YfhO family protein [Ruminococcus sp.]|nr:YfhO family protein [Ruminococcus sp.]
MDNERFSSADIKTDTLRCTASKKQFYESGIFCFVLSFLIPFGIMLYSFAQAGIHPFGDKQMLVVDLWHQYFPFFRVVREKLVSGGSFLYSWKNGLGTNFLSLISYYAASPLNWISVFFTNDGARDAQMFLLCAKIGFGGAFFSTFLRYTYKRRDISVCIFSCMYALSSYTLGYYWNVMWFDTIALFPLVMLGIVAICREGKWKVFTLALALSLISNYYIAYFTCVFSVFMFASASIIECKGVKDWFRKLGLMIRSSVLGIGLGGFMLLPAYFGLQLTYSARNTMPKNVTIYEKWQDIFANLLSYSEPTKVEGLPNFACGMLALMLFGVFFFSFGIKLREKISSLIMLAVITVSCNINILNYIFHGFHFTNQIPYRFAFIFSFVLASSAYRAMDIIMKKGVKICHLIFMLVCPAAVFFLKWYTTREKFSAEGAFTSSCFITAAFLLVFISVKMFPFKSTKMRNNAMCLALGAALISEFAGNAQIGVRTVTTTNYNEYPTKNTEVQKLLSDIRSQDDSPFYRLEMTNTYTLNDSALYGYYGLSQFSSAANVSVTKFMSRLGLYASEAGNRYYYRLSTPVTNSLLGLKYLICKNGPLHTEEMALKHRNVANGVHMYENKYPLSLGFMMNSDILDMPDKQDKNPFLYQNELISRATGIEGDVYSPQSPAIVENNNIDVTRNSFGNYTFRALKKDESADSVYTYSGVKDGYLYGYASGTGGCCNELAIKCGGATIDSGKLIEHYPLVYPMGNAQDGEESTVKVGIKSGTKTGSYRLMVYALSKEAFEKAYSALADEQLEISSFSDTEICGTVDVKQDGVLFLSIPYEKGWSVYIDGQKAETFRLMQSMLGAKVSQGHHDIRIRYIPEGLITGVCCSSAALALFILFAFMDLFRKKRKVPDNSEAAAYSQPVEFLLDDEDANFFFEDAESTAEILYSGEEADDEKP